MMQLSVGPPSESPVAEFAESVWGIFRSFKKVAIVWVSVGMTGYRLGRFAEQQ